MRARGVGRVGSCRLPAVAVLLFAAVALSACLPMGLIITTYASEGAAYLATGKSLRDHALSGMMGEDCALLRLTDGDPICIVEAGNPEHIIPDLGHDDDCRIWRVAPNEVFCVVRLGDPMPELVATAQCPAALDIDGRMLCVQAGAASPSGWPESGAAPNPAFGPGTDRPGGLPGPAFPQLTPSGIF